MKQEFQVKFAYPVHFTEGAFKEENLLLRNLIQASGRNLSRVLLILDEGLMVANPGLRNQISAYFRLHKDILSAEPAMIVIPGGEAAKNDRELLFKIVAAVHDYSICRHSYLIAVGGGALLDLAGFAAAIAHRGVRHIRIPTTVLAQNDSGVGVKNGINFQGKKNFLGTFCPPFAVINDSRLLETLSDRDWISGISEAVKVALIKDKSFFYLLRNNVSRLVARDGQAMNSLIRGCAELHLQHIGGADPFETGSSRPLDFGHWAAHKMEQLSGHAIRHGEAVASGIAIDVVYSWLIGYLPIEAVEEVLSLLSDIGFMLYHDCLSDGRELLAGLNEFREHLGGELTITLLDDIGSGIEVNQIDEQRMLSALDVLRTYQKEGKIHLVTNL